MTFIDFLLDKGWNALLWGALAAGGSAMLFSVPRRILGYCIAGGAIAVFMRNCCLHYFHLPIELSSFIGALCAGFWAVAWVHVIHTPGTVIAIPSIIPMVPGVFCYKALMGCVQFNQALESQKTELLAQIVSNGSKGALTMLAIAIGAAIPIIFDRKVSERKRAFKLD